VFFASTLESDRAPRFGSSSGPQLLPGTIRCRTFAIAFLTLKSMPRLHDVSIRHPAYHRSCTAPRGMNPSVPPVITLHTPKGSVADIRASKVH